MTNRFLAPALAAVAAAVLAGCNTGPEQANQPPLKKTDSGKEFKVALLTSGPISDAGWNAMAFEALQAVAHQLGAKVNTQEVSGTQIRDAMRSYAQEGYQLVFGNGYEYNEPAMQVAGEFPKTVFVSSSGSKTAPNVGAFRFYLEEGFYLAGYMAARLSKSNVVAMIGGPKVPSIGSTFKAFRAGAQSAGRGTRVIEIFTGQEKDVAAARRATLQAIDQGADFVIHQVNAGAPGVFAACKEKGVKAIGSNLNQNGDPTKAVVASAVILSRSAFVNLAQKVRDSEYTGAITAVGMKEDAVDFVIDPKFEEAMPPELAADLKAKKKAIQLGQLDVPKDKF